MILKCSSTLLSAINTLCLLLVINTQKIHMSNKQAHSRILDSKTKANQIREKLRQQQVEGLLTRLRCLQSQQKGVQKLSLEIQSSFLRMNESVVLDAISQYLQNESTFFQFQSIELYLKIIPSFCPQMGSRVVALIISSRKLYTDTSFMNLALLVANKCQKSLITNYTNLQKCIDCFITEKSDQFDCIQRLVQLLCVILAKEGNKRDVLQAIHENRSSLKKLGKLNECYLKMVVLCCYYGLCFVCESDISYYLDLPIMLQKDDCVDLTNHQIYLLCRIVCAFFRQNKTTYLIGNFLNWMSILYNLDLISCKDKEEMLQVVLCMFEHKQLVDKQKLSCLMVADRRFISFLVQLFRDSQSVLSQLSMRILSSIISFSSEHSFKQLNLNFSIISKTILRLSPDLQSRANLTILQFISSMLTKYQWVFTEQECRILEQKLRVLWNTKALQNEAQHLLLQLDSQYF